MHWNINVTHIKQNIKPNKKNEFISLDYIISLFLLDVTSFKMFEKNIFIFQSL